MNISSIGYPGAAYAPAGRPAIAADAGNDLPMVANGGPAAGAGSDASAELAAAQQRVQQHVQDYIAKNDQVAHFTFDESSGLTIVQIVNRSSGEVVRQIPTEEVVRIAQYMQANNFHVSVKA